MTTLEAQHEVITNLLLENKKLERERDEAREAAAKWESSFDAMERAGAEQARRADENREWALRAERERDEAREKYATEATEHMLYVNKLCNERDEVRQSLMVIEDRCVDCEDACDDIQKIRDIARSALEK